MPGHEVKSTGFDHVCINFFEVSIEFHDVVGWKLTGVFDRIGSGAYFDCFGETVEIIGPICSC